MRLTALVVLIVLLGCAHDNPFSVDALKAQGYAVRGTNPQYQVWSKETRDDGRRLHLCIVPTWGGGGYVWSAVVYVDGREAWNYSIGGESSQPPLQTGISCRTSDPLPEGVVSLRTMYKYYN